MSRVLYSYLLKIQNRELTDENVFAHMGIEFERSCEVSGPQREYLLDAEKDGKQVTIVLDAMLWT